MPDVRASRVLRSSPGHHATEHRRGPAIRQSRRFSLDKTGCGATSTSSRCARSMAAGSRSTCSSRQVSGICAITCRRAASRRSMRASSLARASRSDGWVAEMRRRNAAPRAHDRPEVADRRAARLALGRLTQAEFCRRRATREVVRFTSSGGALRARLIETDEHARPVCRLSGSGVRGTELWWRARRSPGA